MNKLFGKKIGMTRYFLAEGRSVPVTVVQVGPCVVTQRKTVEKEGYNAIQLGYGQKAESRTNLPRKGHFKASGGKCFSWVKEVRVGDVGPFEVGQEIKADFFQPGDTVHVRGKNKGRGFAGVMKRWGFGGGRKTHGSRSHRIPGSVGNSATPAKIIKGRKMPGQMGNANITVKNLVVVDVRPEMDVLLLKGSVPGGSGNFLEISKVS